MADLRHYRTGRRFIEKHRPASASREAEARGSVRTPASRAALTFRGALNGITRAQTRRENGEDLCERMKTFPLMPAKAGIQRFAKSWVPAFAGTS